MRPLPVRLGMAAGFVLAFTTLGLCAERAGAEPPDTPPEIVVLVVPPGMEAAQDVIWCESRNRWDIVSEDGEHWGGWQFHRASHEPKALALGWTWEEMMEDPMKQTTIAIALWRAQGWAPWPGCSP